MNKIEMLILIIFIILIFILIFYFYQDDVSFFKSSLNNKSYGIRSSGSNEEKEQAINYISNVSEKVNLLVSYMKNNGLPDQISADRLYNRWNNCKLRETSSTDTSIAFTINKGHEIRICIRKEDGSFEDPNTAMFVILHELAHIMSISYGHNDEFQTNFSYITHLASSLGLYIPENFQKSPKTYCGTSITTTPCSNGTCSTK